MHQLKNHHKSVVATTTGGRLSNNTCMWSSSIVPPPQLAGFVQWQLQQQQQAAALHRHHHDHYQQQTIIHSNNAGPTAEGDAGYAWHSHHQQNHQQTAPSPPSYEPPRQIRRLEGVQADYHHLSSHSAAAAYHAAPTHVASHGEAPSIASRRVVNPEMYDKFCETRKVGDMQRGIFFLPQFVSGPIRPPSPGGTITVDLELWNNYWAAFSEELSYHEDNVRSFLKTQESMGGSEIGAGAGKLNRRRVVIKSPMPIHSIIPPGSDPALTAHVLSIACLFGVVEAIKLSVDEVRVQFTTSTAAILFASFVRSVDASVVFPSQFGGSPQQTTAANNLHRPARPVNVFLVEHRYSTTSGPRRLVLGRKLDIPSIFLNALLRDLFEATTIEYQTGSFVVEFTSFSSAQYALHVLQKSFRMIFGLTLAFYEPGEPLLNLTA